MFGIWEDGETCYEVIDRNSLTIIDKLEESLRAYWKNEERFRAARVLLYAIINGERKCIISRNYCNLNGLSYEDAEEVSYEDHCKWFENFVQTHYKGNAYEKSVS